MQIKVKHSTLTTVLQRSPLLTVQPVNQYLPKHNYNLFKTKNYIFIVAPRTSSSHFNYINQRTDIKFHIKTLKIAPTCFDRKIIIREPCCSLLRSHIKNVHWLISLQWQGTGAACRIWRESACLWVCVVYYVGVTAVTVVTAVTECIGWYNYSERTTCFDLRKVALMFTTGL